ncbi:MAG: hypothetical protein LBV23_02905 [Deltaproteobacteria bacterium]|nr:hypothetical protein [Deltaproteobacteria bacterium]
MYTANSNYQKNIEQPIAIGPDNKLVETCGPISWPNEFFVPIFPDYNSAYIASFEVLLDDLDLCYQPEISLYSAISACKYIASSNFNLIFDPFLLDYKMPLPAPLVRSAYQWLEKSFLKATDPTLLNKPGLASNIIELEEAIKILQEDQQAQSPKFYGRGLASLSGDETSALKVVYEKTRPSGPLEVPIDFQYPVTLELSFTLKQKNKLYAQLYNDTIDTDIVTPKKIIDHLNQLEDESLAGGYEGLTTIQSLKATVDSKSPDPKEGTSGGHQETSNSKAEAALNQGSQEPVSTTLSEAKKLEFEESDKIIISRLKDQVSVLSDKFINIKISTFNLNRKRYRLTKKNQALTEQLNEVTKDLEECKKQLKLVVAERKEIKQAFQDRSDELQLTKNKVEEYKNKALENVEILERQTEKLGTLTHTNAELNEKLNQVLNELEDFKKNPSDIIDENLALKKLLEDFEARENDFKEELNGKTEALNLTNQMLQESNKLNAELKTDLMGAGQWLVPETLNDVVEAGKRYYSNKLIFHELLNQSISAFAQSDNFLKTRMVQEAVKFIKALAEKLHPMKFADENNNSIDTNAFRNATGIPLSMTERRGTKRDQALEDARTCFYKGEKITFYPHLKSTIQGKEFRLHFQFIENERKILICHLGQHLPTAGTIRLS